MRNGKVFWWIALAIFGVMVVANYFPVLSGRIPFPRDVALMHSAWDEYPRVEPPQHVPHIIDIVAFFYPSRALISQTSQNRALPLWNPYIMGGVPFEADSQSSLFAPLTSLYYVLPLKAAWTADLAIRLLLAALFMALFVRSIGGSSTGAIVSGILFALCGFTIEWQGQSLGDASIWLPLICYSIHRLHLKPSGSSIAIAAFAFSMPVLAGHPETAAHSTLTGSAMALFLWVSPIQPGIRRFDRRFLLCFVLCGVLALGLASVQMVPTLQWLNQMGPQFDVAWPVLDRHQIQGFFSRDIQRDPSSAEVEVPEGAAYVGMLGLLAAILAPFHRSRKYVGFLSVMTAVAVLVAFGFQPVRWLVVHLPFIKAMKNGRMTLLADFGIAALAGLGITALEEERLSRRAWTALGIGFVAVSLCIFEVFRATLSPVAFWRSPWSSLIFLLATVVVIGARLSGHLKGRLFPIAVCGLAAVEMLSFSYGYLGFTRAADVFPNAPVFEFLKSRGNPATFRIAKDPYPIPQDVGMIFDIQAADGYEMTTERARTFASGLTMNRDDGLMFVTENILRNQDRRLDLLNLKYFIVSKPSPELDQLLQRPDRFEQVFSRGGVAVFENRSVLPRAFSVPVSGVEVIPDTNSQLARLKQTSFDPERSVILSEASPIAVGTQSTPDGRVDLLSSGTNESTYRVQSSSNVVIVISQFYYPGWKATIDGSEVPVIPVDYALTGLVAPAGTHQIRLFFQPMMFRVGAALSLVALAVIVGLASSALAQSRKT